MDSTIEHTGIINSIEGKTAHVVIEQMSACAECHARGVCTASDKEEKIVDAQILEGQFEVGERVMVLGQKSIAVQAVLLAYILPFVLVIAAVFIANYFTENELIIGTIGLLILVPYLIFLRTIRKRIQSRFQFYVSKI